MNQNQKPAIIRYVLLIVALVEFYAEFVHHRELIFFSKPLLLPLIAAYYFFSLNGIWNTVHKLIMLAFLFSWFGDISLMLTPETVTDTELMGIPKSKYFFLGGLGSFLVTQILFISSYRKSIDTTSVGKGFHNKMIYLPFLIYWLVILAIVLPPLQNNAEKKLATIPVIFYAAVLIAMAATALSRFGKTNSKSFWFTFIGASIFVVSDSLIAINFLALSVPTYYAGFSIITTYAVAEYLIAEGILKHHQPDI